MIESKAQHNQPSAPRITCTIKMNYWCIVQADAGLNMLDLGDYRVWKMSAPGGGREVVIIRESKSCDSLTNLRPKKKLESNDQLASGEFRHEVELTISEDGACTLKIDYVAGNTDSAREAKQLAMNRLYLCDRSVCDRPLLSIK